MVLTIRHSIQEHYLPNSLISKICLKNVIWEIKRTNFGNQKCHFRNQTRQILEIKSLISEIKRTNSGNQRCHFRNQTRQIQNQNDTIETKKIFPFNHRNINKIKENKKRIGNSKFYLWYSSNTVINTTEAPYITWWSLSISKNSTWRAALCLRMYLFCTNAEERGSSYARLSRALPHNNNNNNNNNFFVPYASLQTTSGVSFMRPKTKFRHYSFQFRL